MALGRPSSNPGGRVLELDSPDANCVAGLAEVEDWALTDTAAKIASPETKQARRITDIKQGEDMCATSLFKLA
jgi:hypothetical protein